ncbi:MAG: hypothetical protein AAF203_00655 [Pseudomonadota bacterium]
MSQNRCALLLGFLLFFNLPSLSAKVLNPSTWIIYEVQEGQWLWAMARNLGVPESRIPQFISALAAENPQIKNRNELHHGEKVFISPALVKQFVDPKNHFKYYSVLPARSVASQTKEKLAKPSQFSLRSLFSFSRLDANQRGSGASATLLSDVNFGLSALYEWDNQLGPTGLELGLSWMEFTQEEGGQIPRNQIVSFQLEWFQGWKLHRLAKIYGTLGYYQTPYLFTDNANALFLKVGGQPGVSAGGQIRWGSLPLITEARLTYLLNGYAGGTVVDEGVQYRIETRYEFKRWQQNWGISLRYSGANQLTEVTSQEFTDIGLGLRLTW